MRRTLACLLFVVVCMVALMTTGSSRLAMIVPLAAAAAVVWRAWQCPHPGPLGLLPPTVDAEGTRVPARWFCDACGASWPANFEREHHPVRKFEGFDAAKAVSAARRADELFRRQHQLALRRAGAVRKRAPRPPRPAAEVVAIDNVRRLVK
jgi:hypothetical protein